MRESTRLRLPPIVPPNAMRMPLAACRISDLVTSMFEKPLLPPISMHAVPGPPPAAIERRPVDGDVPAVGHGDAAGAGQVRIADGEVRRAVGCVVEELH